MIVLCYGFIMLWFWLWLWFVKLRYKSFLYLVFIRTDVLWKKEGFKKLSRQLCVLPRQSYVISSTFSCSSFSLIQKTAKAVGQMCSQISMFWKFRNAYKRNSLLDFIFRVTLQAVILLSTVETLPKSFQDDDWVM